MYSFFRATVVRPVLFLWFHVRVTGRDNIPRRGPVIIASNHLDFLDSLFLPAVVQRKMTYLVAADYYAKKSLLGRLLGWFLTQIGQLPIDRSGGSASKASLETGLRVLENDGLIGIYPEGTRSRDGLMHRGRTGVARLVLASGVTVIPAAIQGSDRIRVAGSRLPKRADIQITFGRPLHFETVDGDYDAKRLRAVTDEIMQEIARLTPQEYVDSYAPTTERG
ncbi:1-acyl-sn-glycerol-3-phosphate acyltransferase [Frondihabitans sp. 762G35]|uniref:lysophospholipid acyltransferase family protein n=1 Tax=Frondihabitans sp. 762G35 TaxID=1446794 RepID=UPI000D212992|nr:lysophospholipid acyltransferase family protein [Frondihabitans sp. 762G35]ARC56393.1 1-acyl-sn-glycerol-3-phosphate acyltransferase [Frondihabitans sp. 762G35]